jgi:CheY-like chemotaxis protein
MPDTDGFAVLEELKADERTHEIPVVIVSAKTLTAGEWELLRRYAESVWQKGNFSAKDLAGHVAEMLGDEVTPGKATQQKFTSPLLEPETSPRTPLLKTFGQDHRPNIMVIDDYATDARLLRRLFEANHRFKVTEAHTATEALDMIKNGPPDLIVLDLILPDITGEDLLGILRKSEKTCNIPIVVVSAKDINPDLRAQLAAQVDSVWSKAVLDRSNLLAHVETILTE